jgi:hypothetical protein
VKEIKLYEYTTTVITTASKVVLKIGAGKRYGITNIKS